MSDVLNRAAKLAEALRRDAPYRTLREAVAAARSDEDTARLLEAHGEKQRALQRELTASPRNPRALSAASAELQAVEAQLKAEPLYQAVEEAQRAFDRQISDIWDVLGTLLGAEVTAACGGCGKQVIGNR